MVKNMYIMCTMMLASAFAYAGDLEINHKTLNIKLHGKKNGAEKRSKDKMGHLAKYIRKQHAYAADTDAKKKANIDNGRAKSKARRGKA